AENELESPYALPYLARAPAARGRAVFAVDASSYFSRPGPRIVDGLEILAWAIHPESFPEPPKDRITRVVALGRDPQHGRTRRRRQASVVPVLAAERLRRRGGRHAGALGRGREHLPRPHEGREPCARPGARRPLRQGHPRLRARATRATSSS